MSKFLTVVRHLRFTAVITLVATATIAKGKTIDTDGARGRDGQDGTSYSTSPGSSGGRGANGGDATRSTPGGNAGDITVRLQDSGDNQRGTLVVIGEANSNRINHQESLAPSTQLILQARGGRGGNGGDGGHGQGGCNGSDGQDATRYSSGSNGSPGCDGGDGGDATPGSDGGRGGHILVSLKAEDLHLTPFVQWDFSGGAGGSGSSNGRGGSGGHGGRGGSSYSWTETEYRTESYDCSESNGDGSYNSRTCYQNVPYTTYHSSPGGYSGSSGRSGSPGRGNTSGGNRGQDGSATFVVEFGDGSTRRYNRAFDLRLKSYRVRDEDGNGVFEPGEKVIIDRIVVGNDAEMPTPGEKGQVIVTLNSSSWLLAEPQSLVIPQINGGGRYEVPGQLVYTLRNNRLNISNEVATTTDTVVPAASVRKFSYRLNSFSLPKTLTISYPVELNVSVGKRRLGLEESTPITWRIRNLSSKPIAVPSSGRRIEVGVSHLGGDAPRGFYVFTPAQESLATAQAKSEHWLFHVGEIAAGGSILLHGQIKINPKADPYTRFSLGSSLYLSDFKNYEQLEKIEQDNVEIQIGQVFKYNPDAEFLFVTNQNTSKAQVDTIINTMKGWGFKIDLWDFTYYDELAIFKTLQDYGKSLADLYIDRTIVLLTDSSSDSSESTRMLQHLSQKDFELAATRQGINFIAIGSDPTLLNGFLTRLVAPPADAGAIQKVYASEKELLTHLAQDPNGTFHGLGYTQAFKTADQKAIENKALDILRKVNDRSQGTQHFVTYQNTGKANEIQFVLHRSLNYRHGRATVIQDLPANLASASFYQSEDFFRKFTVGLGFTQKLRFLLMDRSQWSPEQNRMLIETIVAELIEEADLHQGAIKKRSSQNTQLWVESLVNAVKNQNNRSMTGLTDEVNAIIARFDFYLQKKYGARSDFANVLTKDLTHRKEVITQIQNQLEAELQKRSAVLIGNAPEENVRRMLTWGTYYKTNRTLATLQKLQNNAYKVRWTDRRTEGF